MALFLALACLSKCSGKGTTPPYGPVYEAFESVLVSIFCHFAVKVSVGAGSAGADGQRAGIIDTGLPDLKAQATEMYALASFPHTTAECQESSM